MANKRWTHLKLQNGDKVTFIPPAPNGAQLGGVTQSQRESISQIQPLKSDVEQIESDVEQVKSDVEQVKQDVTQVKDDYLALQESKITKPTDAPTVGKVLKVKQVNADGTFLCEWADGGAVDDVTVDGVSVVDDGVAKIQRASSTVSGTIRTGNSFDLGSSGTLRVNPIAVGKYPSASEYSAIGKGTLDTVLSTPTIMPTLTDDAKVQARERIGAMASAVKIPKQMAFTITEDMLTVTYDDTKGVAPYNTSYGYTNIEIDKEKAEEVGFEWVEGAMYTFVLNNRIGVAANRNGRIRIGGDDDGDAWHPIMSATNAIASCYTLLTIETTIYWTYKTNNYNYGALHAQSDNNTQYAYLVNQVQSDSTESFVKIDSKGFGARYSLIFPTTPIEAQEELWSSLVSSSSTSTTKKAVTPTSGKFYIDRHPLYIYSANIAAGVKAVNALYQDYGSMDARYTCNTLGAYLSRNKRAYLWLKNFDQNDMSFESDVTIGNLLTSDNIATRFPNTVTGDVYLYFLGYTQNSYNLITPNFTQLTRIYKYTPSTGAMVATNILAG